MGKCMYMRKGEVHTAPKKPGIALGDMAEGSIVKLNENGSPVEFYVACHDYESGLNGVGRTLLVRKDSSDSQMWMYSDVTYASSDIDTWLNGTYKNRLDSAVQTAIETTKFYYTPSKTAAVSTLERSIFIPSLTELGESDSSANIEGSAFPVASQILDTGRTYWTRTPYKTSSGNYVFVIAVGGGHGIYQSLGYYFVRPCFTLPSTAIFDETTLLFKEAA